MLPPTPSPFRLLAGLALAAVLPAAFGAAPAARPNVLFIAVDDLRNELGVLGAAGAKTPQLDAFAATARVFTHHYVQVPTCGASRCALLRGRYPSETAHVSNSAIASTHGAWGDVHLPGWFRRHGYGTYALGKITHHPGGLTGKLWAEGPEELPGAWTRCWIPDTPWRESERMMHAYADGVGRTPGKTPVFQAHPGPDTSFPDAWVADEAIKTLRDLSARPAPWFFAVGFFKPHLPFAAPQRWFDLHRDSRFRELPAAARQQPSWPSGWHKSGEFRGNYAHAGRDPADDPAYAALMQQAYAACVSYVDEQIGRLLRALEQTPGGANTIVVLWGDHGYLLGEHGQWMKQSLFEESARVPLIIAAPGQKGNGQGCERTVETVDIYPTLADLCGLQAPSDLAGASLRPLLENPRAAWDRPAYTEVARGGRSVRTERWRYTEWNGGRDGVELYDHAADPREFRNLAKDPAHAKTVAELRGLLHKNFGAVSAN